MVAIDSNTILVSPIKNRKDEELQRAYLELLHREKEAGISVKNHVLDNECSTSMKELIRKECKLELVPPGRHSQNLEVQASFNCHSLRCRRIFPNVRPFH